MSVGPVPFKLPAGTILAFAGNKLEKGFLECNGDAVSRTTYDDLFAAIGETWGKGDTTTTFNLPDLRGRCLIGEGPGVGLTSRKLGDSTIGSETQSLEISDLPKIDPKDTKKIGTSRENTGVDCSNDGAHGHINAMNTPYPLPSPGPTVVMENVAFTKVTAAKDYIQVPPGGIDGAHKHHITDKGHLHTLETLGDGRAHNNMQPSAVVKWIIKT